MEIDFDFDGSLKLSDVVDHASLIQSRNRLSSDLLSPRGVNIRVSDDVASLY